MIYDVGDIAVLLVSFTDQGGALADPTSVSIAVQLPDLTLVTPSLTPVHDGVGKFHADLTITQPGTYVYRWTGTGALTTVEEGLITAAPSKFGTQVDDLCTLSDVKTWLDLTNTNNDALLARAITAVSELFRSQASRPAFRPTAYTETRNGNGALQMIMRYEPIISVESVMIDGASVTLSDKPTTAGWVNDRTSIMLRGGSWASSSLGIGWQTNAYRFNKGFQNVVIQYHGGWSPIPYDLAQAAIETVAQKFRRRGHIDETSQSLGGNQTVAFGMSDIPKEAMLVLNSYLVQAFIE